MSSPPDATVGVEPEGDESAPEPTPFPVRVDIRSIALTGLFVLAVFYTLFVARAFLVPLIVGLLAVVPLQPAGAAAPRRARIPRSR